ncbi:transcription factor of the MADS box [Tieghemiomyces parasiticus]|uniref:Transcription factor of the MADS box n=1 Tax=Tieghemiomyces parasiticus TaxID=78921 RepID=A0A9W8AD09_9FUNG|nr:transcription factor of the MADS box [Tieghemiomyces parasiticus]
MSPVANLANHMLPNQKHDDVRGVDANGHPHHPVPNAQHVHHPMAPTDSGHHHGRLDAQDARGLKRDHEEDGDDDSDETGSKDQKRAGRRKIKIEFIEDKSRRHITFSKRKAGIMKKAYELSTLTGTQVLLLVVSETGLVYTFTTPKLQPLVTKAEGKNLIQSCLNAPETGATAADAASSGLPANGPTGNGSVGPASGGGMAQDPSAAALANSPDDVKYLSRPPPGMPSSSPAPLQPQMQQPQQQPPPPGMAPGPPGSYAPMPPNFPYPQQYASIPNQLAMSGSVSPSAYSPNPSQYNSPYSRGFQN